MSTSSTPSQGTSELHKKLTATVEVEGGLPDAMSRAAEDLRDENICGSLSDGDTVITCSDLAACYVDAVRIAYMNTVCVWAIGRSSEIDIVDPDVAAVCNTATPCPSKAPPPFNVKPSIISNKIH
uniref:Uncharacterized protein n=1 Tax=Salix viminalis TaxID=40686 RepID=A0A6N2MYY7_SALVM